jgi:6-phosphogluconate dehydrogenase
MKIMDRQARPEKKRRKLMHAQRHYIAAHTSGRIDAKGTFHPEWAKD